jgi:hypothetical protein
MDDSQGTSSCRGRSGLFGLARITFAELGTHVGAVGSGVNFRYLFSA